MIKGRFNLPEELRRPAAEIIVGWQKPLMFSLAQRLEDIGVPANIAIHIEINILFTWAARAAIIVAVELEEREPDRERWTSAIQEDFDAAVEWYLTIPRSE